MFSFAVISVILLCSCTMRVDGQCSASYKCSGSETDADSTKELHQHVDVMEQNCLALLVSAISSDAQLTTTDQDSGEDCNSKFEYIRQSLQEIRQGLVQQNCSPNGQMNPCPAGFNYSVNAVNKCYAVVLQPMDWDSAQARCRALNPKAHLVVINSPLENQIISEILNEHDCSGSHGFNWFWISGHRQNSTTCSSPLVWKSDSRNNQAMGYTNWCPEEPDCGNQERQHCMAFAKDCYSNRNINGWQDDTCEDMLCPMCEFLRFEQP